MLIPNAENAVVDIRKLRDYCLSLEHDDSNHKARLFSSILGMKAENAEELRQILLEVVKVQEARLGRQDEFGQRYTLGSVDILTKPDQGAGKAEKAPVVSC